MASSMDLEHTEDVLVLDQNITFSSMHLKPDLLKGFNDEGFVKPSPIQLQAIPRGKLGMDLICQSKSGTGKTLTFCTIILERINISNDNFAKQDLTPQAMVISPTREIAVQIRDFIRTVGKYYKYLTCDTFIGGVPLSYDKKNLNLGCQIIVGTPGRILQLININTLITFNINIVVLDEADQLFFADSFKLDIKNILLNKTPKNKQIMAFSASYNKDNNIIRTIAAFMRNPQHILISNDKPTLKGVQQYFYHFQDHTNKSDETHDDTDEDITKIAMDKLKRDHVLLCNKMDGLLYILSSIPFNQCIVFINNKNRSKDICKTLNNNGFPSYNIGGDQPQTERLTAIRKLKAFDIRILVSSDLTSRGIDCDRVNLVINLDLPFNAETYLHRVGRTGRFGTYGLSITFVTLHGKEMNLLNNYIQTLNSNICKLPDDLQEIVNQNYLTHSLTLKNEEEKEQRKAFAEKREKVLSEKKDKTSEILREPSNIVKDIYIQKEKEKALWNAAKKKKKKYRESDEWALSVDDYNEMSQEDRVELIKELMHLEWQYAEWMYDREDYVTQKMLYHQQSLYYKRLFVMPLNDFYLEMERENIFAAAEYERDELKAPKKDRNFVEERKMMEVKLEKLSSSSSEVDYLSVDSEQAEQKRGMRINEQNTANVSNLDLFSHRGLVEKNHHNLEMDDLLRDDIHMSPNPNPRWFEENETIHEYIGKQIESELKHLKMTAELEQMAQEEEEEEKEWMHDEGSSSCSSTQMEDEDGGEEDEEYILDRFREILTNHQFMPQVDDDCDGDEDEVDLMLDQIETLCRDVDKYHNKYMNHWQKSKALRNQLEIAENTLDDLVNEHDRLKQEYLKLRHENQTLSDKLKLQETPQGGGNTTAGGPNDDGMEERDILYQLKDDLLHLRQDINDSQQSAKSEYKQSKIRLESMCEPLSDLANDFDSQVLKDALTKLSKSLNDIHNLKKQRLYQHGPLANIVESNIDDIDDLLNSMQQQQMNNKATTTKGGGELEDEAVSGNVDEMDKLYPELIYFDDDDDDDNEHKDEFVAADTAGQQENIEFDANFPVVRRIEIGGNWFNKKARAVIEWNGSTFTRKMADFKWLWRMLLLNSSVDRVVPDYPNDIPESLWPQGYLRRRKRELNLFLMQCHSLPWIKNYNLYYDIFLEQEKHEWKRKRDEFDEEIMQKIKKKEATYIQHTIDKNNNANNSDNNDNDTNHHNNNNNQYHQ
eukprot:344999_1